MGPAVYVCKPPEQLRHLHRDRCRAPGVVAVGKKSLLWLPFFGLIFWLSGKRADRQIQTLPRHRHHRPGGGSHQASVAPSI